MRNCINILLCLQRILWCRMEHGARALSILCSFEYLKSWHFQHTLHAHFPHADFIRPTRAMAEFPTPGYVTNSQFKSRVRNLRFDFSIIVTINYSAFRIRYMMIGCRREMCGHAGAGRFGECVRGGWHEIAWSASWVSNVPGYVETLYGANV